MKPPAASSQTGFVQEIPSILRKVDTVCSDADYILRNNGLECRSFDVCLLLREFLNNAIIHGNAAAQNRRVHVTMKIGRKWIVLQIADSGSGFHHRRIGRDPPSADSVSGRGLAIGAIYADRIQFNKHGNKVKLWVSKTQRKERALWRKSR